MKRASLRAVVVIAGLGFLASCNGSSSGNGFIGNLPGPSTPAFTRLFDGQFTTKIFIIAPPIAAPLTPAGSFASLGSDDIAFNATDGVLAASTLAPSIVIYNPPYSSSTTPVVTIAGGTSTLVQPEELAWDGSGSFWVADEGSGTIKKFSPPFSASSAPSATNTPSTLSSSSPWGLAINPSAGLMFVGDPRIAAGVGSNRHVYGIPAPYTGTPTVDLTVGPNNRPFAVAFDQLGRLFVGYGSGAKLGTIDVFVPPYATGNAPAFTLTGTPGNSIFHLAFDPAQNLYVQKTDGSVDVFSGPILGPIAAPTALLGCPTPPGSCGIWAGLAFGP